MATVSAIATMGSSAAEGSSSGGGENMEGDHDQWVELFTHTLETSAMLATLYVAATHQKEIGDAANMVASGIGEAKQLVENPNGFVQDHAVGWVKGSLMEKAKNLEDLAGAATAAGRDAALNTINNIPGGPQTMDGLGGVLGFFTGGGGLPANFSFTIRPDGKAWTLVDKDTGYGVTTSSDIPAWLRDMPQVQEQIQANLETDHEFSASENPTWTPLSNLDTGWRAKAVEEGDTWDDSWDNFKEYIAGGGGWGAAAT